LQNIRPIIPIIIAGLATGPVRRSTSGLYHGAGNAVAVEVLSLKCRFGGIRIMRLIQDIIEWLKDKLEPQLQPAEVRIPVMHPERIASLRRRARRRS
jgi:hypothetical protein